MYRRPLTNISHAFLSLLINVPKNLQEMLPYFHKILYIFKTEYSFITFCIFILREQRNAFYRLFQCLLYPYSKAWNKVKEAFLYPLNRH